MSDPAVAAAVEAWTDRWPNVPKRDESVVLTVMTAAARKALAQLRELHRPFFRVGGYGEPDRTVCNHCLGPIKWPCTTAVYVYPSEEL